MKGKYVWISITITVGTLALLEFTERRPMLGKAVVSLKIENTIIKVKRNFCLESDVGKVYLDFDYHYCRYYIHLNYWNILKGVPC